jgi:hypothetical protein
VRHRRLRLSASRSATEGQATFATFGPGRARPEIQKSLPISQPISSQNLEKQRSKRAATSRPRKHFWTAFMGPPGAHANPKVQKEVSRDAPAKRSAPGVRKKSNHRHLASSIPNAPLHQPNTINASLPPTDLGRRPGRAHRPWQAARPSEEFCHRRADKTFATPPVAQRKPNSRLAPARQRATPAQQEVPSPPRRFHRGQFTETKQRTTGRAPRPTSPGSSSGRNRLPAF